MSVSLFSDASGANERRGFCIFIETLCQGPTPAVRDEAGLPVIFETENEAHREIVDSLLIRLQQFMKDEREFDDAVAIDEFLVSVRVLPDGCIIDDEGRHFGKE